MFDTTAVFFCITFIDYFEYVLDSLRSSAPKQGGLNRESSPPRYMRDTRGVASDNKNYQRGNVYSTLRICDNPDGGQHSHDYPSKTSTIYLFNALEGNAIMCVLPKSSFGFNY